MRSGIGPGQQEGEGGIRVRRIPREDMRQGQVPGQRAIALTLAVRNRGSMEAVILIAGVGLGATPGCQGSVQFLAELQPGRMPGRFLLGNAGADFLKARPADEETGMRGADRRYANGAAPRLGSRLGAPGMPGNASQGHRRQDGCRPVESPSHGRPSFGAVPPLRSQRTQGTVAMPGGRPVR